MSRDDKYTGYVVLPSIIFMASCELVFLWLLIRTFTEWNAELYGIIFFGLWNVACIGTIIGLMRMRLVIDPKGVRYITPKKKGEIRWEDMKCVGVFRIPLGQDKLMFFSTIDEVWTRTDMMRNDLPLDKLMKVMPNKKIEAIVAKYYNGEIIYLEKH